MATIQQTYDIPNASKIILEGWGDVQLEQGEIEKMIIETDLELLPKLKTTVNGSQLELGFKNPLDHLFNFQHLPIHYSITVRRLDKVQIIGSGTVTCPQARSDELRLGVSGSGNMRFGEIEAGGLEVSIPGSGEVSVEELQASHMKLSIPGSGLYEASGSVPDVEATISGSGKFNGEDLKCEKASVRISGSGQVELGVDRDLDVHISGSGQMRYRGAPAMHTHISGSGRVRPL